MTLSISGNSSTSTSLFTPTEDLEKASAPTTKTETSLRGSSETSSSRELKSPSPSIDSTLSSTPAWKSPLSKLLDWFTGKTGADLPLQETSNAIPIQETLDPVPALKAPQKSFELNLPEAHPLKEAKPLPPRFMRNLEEALQAASKQTIESLMFLIFKLQLDLEKERAATTEKVYAKHLQFQALQQQLLVEIKDILANDAQIASRFGTAQTLALAANFLAGVAAVASQFGLIAPIYAFLSTASTGALAVTTLGAEAYFDRASKEHQSRHETCQYKNNYYSQQLEEARKLIMQTAEADSVFKERWIALLKRASAMSKIINQ